MSMTEQKFDSLCTFAKNLDSEIQITINAFRQGRTTIKIDSGRDVNRFLGDTPDDTLTDALRHLRKIKIKQS